LFGENVHEYLAPCIYEGEGEMLGMAFFKSLVKHHGTLYFEPIGKALAAAGIKKPNPFNPAHAWALRSALPKYGKWFLAQYLVPRPRPALPPMPSALQRHAEFAASGLQNSPLEISGTMRKHQLKLADRQCRMSELSSRLQKLVVMLCTCLYAARQEDEVVRSAAEVLCDDFTRELTGRRVSDRELRRVTSLGAVIADGGFKSIEGLKPDEILMSYDND
jgi:hypothetical protein